jgi:hypothetical protein
MPLGLWLLSILLLLGYTLECEDSSGWSEFFWPVNILVTAFALPGIVIAILI